MSKLLWVVLPLLLAALAAGVQAWRGRPYSRHAVNMASSLLLLGYLAATAGLGIFWVANQQLPVFDWHYLFGYATVLLLVLHLVYNLPLVWRWLARRGARPAPARRTRRAWTAALGALLAGAAGFALGLRHGRTELRIDAGPAGGGAAAVDAGADAAVALMERFHAVSAHTRTGVLTRAASDDWGEPPPSFKRDARAPRVPLPRPGSPPADARAALGAVLWHTAGVTDPRVRLNLRASPSSGALFPTELYVQAPGVAELGSGPWHYDARDHALERLPGAGASDAALGAAGDDVLAVVVATAVFRRSGYKYRDRTLRYVLADLGHALENLSLAADALGLGATLVPAFDDARVGSALGLDPAEEGVLMVAVLRAASSPRAASADAATPGSSPAWAPLPLGTLPQGGRSLTQAIHAATSLQRRPGAARAVRAPTPPAGGEGAGRIPLPAPAAASRDVLARIAARRSVRRFAATPVPAAALAAVLAALSRERSPALSAAPRVDIVVHAVDGLAPGAYRHDALGHALVPRKVPGRGRAASRAAALDQDVIGDAACVLVLSIDRAAWTADPLGPARGYRHAFVEAGRLGERVYLEAGAQGLGACAVGAFYDDEATALVAGDASRERVVHLVALGVPAR